VREIALPSGSKPTTLACGESSLVVGNATSGTLYRVDNGGSVAATIIPAIPAEKGVWAVTRLQNGRIVATAQSGSVTFCDREGMNCESRQLGGEPRGVSAFGSSVAVVSWTANTVAVFDGDTRELRNRWPVPRLPRGLFLG
jgi:hypothetical protein